MRRDVRDFFTKVTRMSIPRLHTINDLLSMPKPQWLIEGLYEANSLVMVAGAPGSFKSFLVLDWIMCMALGKSWHGKQVVPGKVLYILGEGKASLLKRMMAWYTHHECKDDIDFPRLNNNLRITFDVPQLRDREDYGGLITCLTADKFEPSVIVIDTFARSFVGGDENSSLDTGLWIKAAESLRALGYTVVFLHHTRKNTEFGHQFRGSTAISGAMDTIVTVVRNYEDNTVKVAVTKQKDHDEGEPMTFRRQLVTLPNNQTQDSMVLQLLPPTTRTAEERLLKDILDNPALTKAKDKVDEVAARLNITPIAAKQRLWRFKERLKEETLTPEDLAELADF